MRTLDILAAGKGHQSYKLGDPSEYNKAAEAILDMLRSGYVLMATDSDSGKEGKIIRYDKESGMLTLSDQSEVALKETSVTAIAPAAGG